MNKNLLKRMLTIVFSFMISFSTVSTIKATDNFDTLGIIDHVELSVLRDNNSVVIDDQTIVSVFDQFIIDLDFSLDDSIDYRNQQTQFTMPDIFDSEHLVESFDIVIDGELIAVAQRLNNDLTFTMTFTNSDYLVEHSNIKGQMRIFAMVVETQITELKKYPIKFGDQGHFEVSINPPDSPNEPDVAYVWKGGKLQSDMKTIEWSIYVPTYQDLEELRIEDKHSDGHEIDVNSFEVSIAKNFDTSDNPNYIPLEVEPMFGPNNSFTLDIGDVRYKGADFINEPTSPTVYPVKHDVVRVKYLSTITEEQASYSNWVNMKANQLGTSVRDMNSVVTHGGGVITGENRSLNIIKKDGETNVPLVGAHFRIEKYNASQDNWYTYRDDIEMTLNTGVLIDKVTFGTYRLVETVAPVGYELDGKPSLPFNIDASTAQVLEKTMFNYRSVGNLEITKQDSLDHKGLSGAVFALYDLSDNLVYTLDPTDTTGFTSINNIVKGEYKLVEVIVPVGYSNKGYIKNIVIDFNTTTSIQVNNDIVRGGIEVVKKDFETKSPLLGAHFKIVDMDGNIVIKDIVTGSDGRFQVNDLVPGDYRLIETVAPLGYILNEQAIDFTIEVNQITLLKLEVFNTIYPIETPSKPDKPTSIDPLKPITNGGINTGIEIGNVAIYVGIGIIAIGVIIIIIRKRDK